MKIYRIYNPNNLSDKYDICIRDSYEVKHWIINHLDLSIDWRAVELLSYK
jgi:hypothetical protein